MQSGKIVTNEQVVQSGNVFIDLDSVRLPATIDRIDSFNDLALLSATAELASKLLAISLATPTPGMSIYTIGNPAGPEEHQHRSRFRNPRVQRPATIPNIQPYLAAIFGRASPECIRRSDFGILNWPSSAVYFGPPH